MVRSFFVLFLVLLAPVAAAAQTPGDSTTTDATADYSALVTPPAGEADHEAKAPTASAIRAEGTIAIDGTLDEPTWQSAPPANRFLQSDPVNGAPVTQPTEVRFAFDDEYLYVGARMHDAKGAEGVVARLARRDTEPEGDNLQLIFDTFLDHLGRAYFWINPAGVRGDAYGPGGSDLDESWNPIWRAETTVDAEGWTAEMAIPFSQLRYPRGSQQAWGLQILREVNRLNEVQMWSYWGRNDQGGAARFGHLTGIEAPATELDRLELLPYVVAQAETRGEINADDPFQQEREGTLRVGADLKYLLTSDLTLTATVNPDFGQAEVDPAVVNLSAFETFFPEKREFFIEGQGVFGFGGLSCFTCSNASSLDLLFTRRIGRAPQAAGLAFSAGEFTKVPDATTILGAAKLTGRTSGGLSLGALAAVTDRENADVRSEAGDKFQQEVEPMTGYFVGRVKQDLLDGDLQVGAIATQVTRAFDDATLEDRLPAHAEALGTDADLWWANRTYHWLASAALSNVAGDEDAILRLQRSSARYFQRPDRDNGDNGFFSNGFDPTLDVLRGYGFYSRVAKEAGTWRWEASTSVRSPGFEVNDLGFLTRGDFRWLHGNVQRRWSTPGTWYRYMQSTVGAQRRWNFDGDMTEGQVHGSFYWQLPNYWETSIFTMTRPSAFDDRATRGGPVVKSPGFRFVEAYAATDRRKPIVVEVSTEAAWSEEDRQNLEVEVELSFKPASNVSVSVEPSLGRSESSAQFVTVVDDALATAFFGRRYVFADLEQTNFSMDTRVNWTFSPTMSLELFAQPLVSSNDYSNFKEFAQPRVLDKVIYGDDSGTITATGEGADRQYTVDPDGAGPSAAFSFAEPDFNFRSLRGNLVFRWEYLPGSTLFFVWTQDRNATLPNGAFDFGSNVGDLFSEASDNIFLIKATYWLGI